MTGSPFICLSLCFTRSFPINPCTGCPPKPGAESLGFQALRKWHRDLKHTVFWKMGDSMGFKHPCKCPPMHI